MGMLWIWTQDINQNLWYARNEVADSKLEDFERELLQLGAWNVHKYFLYFVAFFRVALLLFIEVDNEKNGVENEKALELDNEISCCIRLITFWLILDFMLPLGIFLNNVSLLKNFKTVLINSLKCSQLISYSDQKCQAGFRPLCNNTLLFQN